MKPVLNFLGEEGPETRPDRSFFHVIPVPMETSVSYGPGTAAGPGAILEASQQLEAWDGESVPMDRGIHTTPAVGCSGSTEEILSRVESRVSRSLSMGAVPVLLGGEHTVTLGALRALKAREDQDFGIVQFDAHADLRETYQGDRFSHACVMRRALDDLDLPLFQIGVRALSYGEHELRRERNIPGLGPGAVHRGEIPDPLLPPGFPKNIYISFDVDGLDPSVIRATGTPVPGGIGWYDALMLLEKSIFGRQVKGFDVVELAPVPGDHASDFAAARLVYAVMGLIRRKSRPLV
ncbi:agmatinase [Desulfospira joergensenii]|uniref:agmatinase n=1 Tax=Desulfospira joergensenii TaxID=53329 RepID=UPI0003B32345|nr:agmatinase [Desulfospira joergensenii]